MKMRDQARRHTAALAAAGAVLLLAACNSDADGDGGEAEASEVSGETLAELIAGQDDLSVVSGTLSDAGLAQAFDGVAAYTILAPINETFDELGEPGKTLRDPEQRPAMVAILRDHIVPGYLTPDDIAKAIELEEDGAVEMRTMGNHTVTFTGKGDAITVTSEDGSSAKFAKGDTLRASNGVAIPVDGLLKQVATAAAPQV